MTISSQLAPSNGQAPMSRSISVQPATLVSSDPPIVGVSASVSSDRPSSLRRLTDRAVGRDRYIDTLRALALVRVVTYHQFGWHWLPVAYPSIGILFAVGGSLMGVSLTRAHGNYWAVLAKRIRRLLPPLWCYGLVIIPIMIMHGWTATEAGGGDPLRHWRLLLFWLLPVGVPPGSDWGYDFVLPLWYVRTYLWLLLLSPALLFLFRRWPKRVLAVPLTIVGASAFGLIDLSQGRASVALLDIATFGACWMLGFARQDGRIQLIRKSVVIPVGFALMAAGMAWAVTHETDTGWDIDNIPLASALYCLGAVLLLLRLYPSFAWMARFPFLDKTMTMISSRAITIYLWHNLAIFLAVPLLDATPLAGVNGWERSAAEYGAAWALTIVAIFLFGWVEDIAARRAPRINPWPRTDPPQSAAAAPRRPGMLLGHHPVRVTCVLAAGAAVVTGLLLWPWNQQTHNGTAGSIGKAVTQYPGATRDHETGRTTPGGAVVNPGPNQPGTDPSTQEQRDPRTDLLPSRQSVNTTHPSSTATTNSAGTTTPKSSTRGASPSGGSARTSTGGQPTSSTPGSTTTATPSAPPTPLPTSAPMPTPTVPPSSIPSVPPTTPVPLPSPPALTGSTVVSP